MNSEDILKKIDKAIGPPENETPEEREKRKKSVENSLDAARIRKAAKF